MAWNPNPTQHKKSQFVLAFVLVLALVLAGIAVTVFSSDTQDESRPEPVVDQQQSVPQDQAVIQEQQQVEPESDQSSETEYDVSALQQILSDWGSAQSGLASVVVQQVGSEESATLNADEQYFTASIYKLYVAYAGYQQVDQGLVDPDEVYLGSKTRAQCLDEMIRTSDSPCAEKLWAELGKTELTEQLESYGLTNTSMSALQTSVDDAAIILERIATGEGLSVESQASFLASMKDQIFRDALNKGFSDSITVYNKIGFNGFNEYHDTAFIELPNGDQFIVSVLTDQVGTTQIVELARQLEAVLAIN